MVNGFSQCRSSLLSPILLHFSFPKMFPSQWLLQNRPFQHAALRTYCSCRAGAASKVLLYSCQVLTLQMTGGEIRSPRGHEPPSPIYVTLWREELDTNISVIQVRSLMVLSTAADAAL